MKKRKNKNNNNSGIIINDSIVLSLEKKQRNNRPLMITLIAILGFAAVINSFFSMFPLHFDTTRVLICAVVFSALDIFISLKKGKALWLIPASFAVFGFVVYANFEKVIFGYKCVYNTIYKIANSTNIDFYREVTKGKAVGQKWDSITLLLILAVFLVAFIIYFFTIFKANPIAIVAVTFPIVEIGLYNGIELSVFWGCLLVSYWFAVLTITFADMEEYDGGKGGFTRKGNLFFPKRSMKFKVTEKCALGVMTSIMCIGLISLGVLKAAGYKRSDKLNLKRDNLKEAINSFSVDDLSSSLMAVSDSLGITLDYEDNKLGNKSRISFKNVNDLSATFSDSCEGAVYLKGYVGSVYNKNEWFEFDENVYKKNSKLFNSFDKYEIHPQELPFYTLSSSQMHPINVSIEALRNKRKCFVPYFTSNYDDVSYIRDTLNDFTSKKEYECRMMPVSPKDTKIFSLPSDIKKIYKDYMWDNNKWKTFVNDYTNSADEIYVDSVLSEDSLYLNYNIIMSALIENDYRGFVYDNYLSYPDNKNFEQIYDEYSDIIEGNDTSTNAGKLETLDALREKMNSTVKYTLSPGKTPSNRDFVNYFLFESHKGYCVHYATAGVMLARMAGIPARYATGYIIPSSSFSSKNQNSDGSYTIKVKDNCSHAWAEIYLDGYGWVPYEFTAGYSEENAQQTTTTTTQKKQTQTKPKTTKNTKKTSSKTSNTKITRTTTASTKTATNNEKHKNSGNGGFASNIIKSRTFKNVLIIVFIIAFVVVTLYVRRKLILNKRKKKIADSNYTVAVAEIYSYTLKMLEFVGMMRENNAYKQFTEDVEDAFSGRYFADGEFEKFMQISLRAVFDKEQISDEDKKYAEQFAEKMAEKLYESSNLPKKLHMKIIDVLI